MQLLRMWAVPLIAILATLFLSGMMGSFALGLPFLLLLVWLSYALFQTRSRLGIALTGGILMVFVVSAIWALKTPGFVEAFFVGRIAAGVLDQTSGPGWQEKAVDSFQLRYKENDPDAAKVELDLKGARARVSKFFNEVPSRTVVVIYPDLQSLEKAVKTELPDWCVGGAFGSMLAITSPDTWSAKTLGGVTIEQILAHEFTHVVVNRLGYNKVPKWLNEGTATSVAGLFSPSTLARVIEKSTKGGLYTLAEVDKYFRNPVAQPSKDAGLMYAIAASIVAYITEHHGSERLARVLTQIGSGKTEDQALQSVLGINRTELEATWLRSLPQSVKRARGSESP